MGKPPTDVEELLRTKFLAKISARVKLENSITKVFRYFDLTDCGYCTLPEFSRALRDYTLGVPPGEVEALFRKYARTNGGKLAVDYKEFSVALATGLPPADLVSLRPVPDLMQILRRQLYGSGVASLCELVLALQFGADEQFRVMPVADAVEVICAHFRGTGTSIPPEHAESVVLPFEENGEVHIDEFLHALREPMSEAGRSLLRACFRKLDVNAEGCVELEALRASYNPARDPRVADGELSADEVAGELFFAIDQWLKFRRGDELPATVISWDEFEDFFLATHPCLPDFDRAFEKVMDLDKSAYGAIKTVGQPAAGMPPRTRAGLHHWQTDTLKRSVEYRDACEAVDLDAAIARVRADVAQRGLTAAVTVVQTFVEMDDDMDNMIDVGEFRRACAICNVKFLDSEEEVLFQTVAKDALLPVYGFLAALHGQLSPPRQQAVKDAWANIMRSNGGWSEAVPPRALQACFVPHAHPAVLHGKTDDQKVLKEFLDTFAILTRTMGGCADGNISYGDFESYYIVVSSTIPTDSYFELLVRRLWGVERLPAAAAREPPSPAPSSQRRFPHIESHIPNLSTSAPFPSSNSRAVAIWPRLREAVAKRGLRGWKVLVSYVEKRGSSGKLIKPDFVRFCKTTGLGFSADELEQVCAQFDLGTGYVDAGGVLACIRGELSTLRQELALGLFAKLAEGSETKVTAERLKQLNTHPTAALGGKTPKDVEQDWIEGVDYWAGENGDFTEGEYLDFMSYVSAILPEDDEFKLLASELIAG
jgi:Ca2+-binding EF-hand superfamily protein